MSVWPAVVRQISDTTGEFFTLKDRRGVGGGCINAAWRLAGEQDAYFVKLNRASLESMFAAEADALREIRATDTVQVPTPLCVGADGDSAWLVLEFIDLNGRGAGDSGALGAQLAAMHAVSWEAFGWHRDNSIGSTPQRNEWTADWSVFWAEQRLGEQLGLAAGNGHRGRLQSSGERLLEVIPRFFSDYQPLPSLLHGDLWCGNVAYGADGEGVIFDPASYYGDRETDLAMTELFGGFPDEFYQGYRSVWPLDPGYGVRKRLYNLYHVLNHLNLFGGGYKSQAESLIAKLLSEC